MEKINKNLQTQLTRLYLKTFQDCLDCNDKLPEDECTQNCMKNLKNFRILSEWAKVSFEDCKGDRRCENEIEKMIEQK